MATKFGFKIKDTERNWRQCRWGIKTNFRFNQERNTKICDKLHEPT